MMRYKVLCAALALLMVAFVFVSCKSPQNNQTDDQQTTQPPAGGTETRPVDENGFELDDLPNNLNYNGETIVILAWDGQTYEEFDVESMEGDVVTNALYKRNRKVEERLGVKLSVIKTKGGANEVNDYVSRVRNDVMTGTKEYDILAAYSRTIAMCAYSGFTVDLMKTRYMNLDMPWWPESLKSQVTINNKLYFCAGDITISLFHNLPVIYFNKDLAAKVSITDEMLYNLVLEGKWTLDKMIELSALGYEDLNGNGQQDDADQYGYLGQTTQVQPLFWGSGITAIDVEDGRLVVSDSFVGNQMHSLLGKILDWLYSSGYARHSSVGNTAFGEGRILFFQNIASYTMTRFNSVEGLNFGIIPIPKNDESQENYLSIMGNTITLYGIPVSVEDEDMVSAVMECMASEGYRQLSPAIYESAMKVRYAPDQTTAKMYDIIRASAFFDNGRIFSAVMDDAFTNTLNTHLKNNNPNWISAMESFKSQLESKVASINDVFSQLN